MKKAWLILEDGSVFSGNSFGADTTTLGELVFNTGMTGYQEILTDPSYRSQIVILTYPLIGNYGINDQDYESDRIHAFGLVVKNYSEYDSHWMRTQSLSEYLKKYGIPGICNVDTRMLTKRIRTHGVMRCLLTTDQEITSKHHDILSAYDFPKNVVEQVSCTSQTHIPNVQPMNSCKIGLVDLGVKQGIIKHIILNGCEVTCFPHDVSYQTLMNAKLDGIFLSNGPGDPKHASQIIDTTRKLLGKIPLFGICLGFQVLALAIQADTYKLKFGHRGSNHPVLVLTNKQVLITSQNHGYAVRPESLPNEATITMINNNDGTLEGFAHEPYGIQAVQFHPEAGPGPSDATSIFKSWLETLY